MHNTTKICGGVEVHFHAFLISSLGGGEWSVSHSGRFNPGERAPVRIE
jgi:hypothetical protein